MAETFAETRAYGEPAVLIARDMLRARGWEVIKIEYDDSVPDQGDLLIHRLWKGEGYFFRFVDVKRNRHWTEPAFPFKTVYLTSNDQLHYNWWYMAFSHDMSHYAFIDMNKVHHSAVEYDETINPRGIKQVSAGIPIRHALFRKVKETT